MNNTDWDQYLPFAVFATNIHENESTGFSPFYLMYGRKPRLPIDAALNYNPPLHFIDLESYQHEVKRYFTQAITIANENIKHSQDKYKMSYNNKAKDVNYKVGDYVLKDSHVIKKGITPKLLPLYQGPYKIVEIRYPNIVIELVQNPKHIETIHVNRTKRYFTQEATEETKNRMVTNDQTVTITKKTEEKLLAEKDTHKRPIDKNQQEDDKRPRFTHDYNLRDNQRSRLLVDRGRST